MKRFLAMLVLTPREQVVVIVLLFVLIAATLIARYRDTPAVNSASPASTPR